MNSVEVFQRILHSYSVFGDEMRRDTVTLTQSAVGRLSGHLDRYPLRDLDERFQTPNIRLAHCTRSRAHVVSSCRFGESARMPGDEVRAMYASSTMHEHEPAPSALIVSIIYEGNDFARGNSFETDAISICVHENESG